MFRSLFFSLLLLLPALANAERPNCKDIYTSCTTECQTTYTDNEQALKNCTAKCLGNRISCAFSNSAESAKTTLKGLSEETAKTESEWKQTLNAFWQGLTE